MRFGDEEGAYRGTFSVDGTDPVPVLATAEIPSPGAYVLTIELDEELPIIVNVLRPSADGIKLSFSSDMLPTDPLISARHRVLARFENPGEYPVHVLPYPGIWGDGEYGPTTYEGVAYSISVKAAPRPDRNDLVGTWGRVTFHDDGRLSFEGEDAQDRWQLTDSGDLMFEGLYGNESGAVRVVVAVLEDTLLWAPPYGHPNFEDRDALVTYLGGDSLHGYHAYVFRRG